MPRLSPKQPPKIIVESDIYSQNYSRIKNYSHEWLWDFQVGALLDKALAAYRHRRNAQVIWRTGDHATDNKVIETAKADPNTQIIAIPYSKGNAHWEMDVIARDPKTKAWQAPITVRTPGDGKCGYHLVDRFIDILKNGIAKYTNAAKTSSIVYPESPAVKKPIIHSQPQPTEEKAVTHYINESKKGLASFDVLLADLGDLEWQYNQLIKHNKQNTTTTAFAKRIEEVKTQAVSALARMEDKDAAIARLYESGLAEKPSIQEIIEKACENNMERRALKI